MFPCETVRMFRMPVRPDAELRIFEERHAFEIFNIVEQNREHLREWLPWVDATNCSEDVAQFIRRGLDQFASNKGFHAGIWASGRIVGAVGLKPIDWQNGKVEIGYWLSADAQGTGLITDCCRAVTQFLFCELGLNRLEIRVAVGNGRSAAVARRLGCTLEGIERQANVLHGRPVDMQRFALLKSDWKQIEGAL
jgi:ribosomal-protein-serine acetyltransferase